MVKKNVHCLLSMVIVQLTLVIGLSGWSYALQFMVGESVWSIPPTPDFYTSWSSSQFFLTGDTLVFDFESDYSNVMQVSQTEYQSCTASSPYQAFPEGPVTLPLTDTGVFYFICSIANYCTLGQKLAVIVHQRYGGSSSPSPVPLPSSEPVSLPSLAPLGSPEPTGDTPLAGNSFPSDSPTVVERSMSRIGKRSLRVDLYGLVVHCWSLGVILAIVFG